MAHIADDIGRRFFASDAGEPDGLDLVAAVAPARRVALRDCDAARARPGQGQNAEVVPISPTALSART
jgi:hypothetical protein